jgi:hypothetical protein
MITIEKLTFGFYPRENFEEDEEKRLETGWVQNSYGVAIHRGEGSWNEAVSMSRDGCRGNFVEDNLIEMIDLKYSKKPHRERRPSRLQRRFLNRRTGEPRPGVHILK